MEEAFLINPRRQKLIDKTNTTVLNFRAENENS